MEDRAGRLGGLPGSGPAAIAFANAHNADGANKAVSSARPIYVKLQSDIDKWLAVSDRLAASQAKRAARPWSR